MKKEIFYCLVILIFLLLPFSAWAWLHNIAPEPVGKPLQGVARRAEALNPGAATPPGHCRAFGQNTRYEWIQAVSLNGVEVVSGDNQGYALHERPLDMSVSQPNTLLLTPGFHGGLYVAHWNAWLDWNRDGQFDDAEKLVRISSNSAVLTAFDIPAAAVPGPALMRIALRFDAPPRGCGEFYFGEVEDFRVRLRE